MAHRPPRHPRRVHHRRPRSGHPPRRPGQLERGPLAGRRRRPAPGAPAPVPAHLARTRPDARPDHPPRRMPTPPQGARPTRPLPARGALFCAAQEDDTDPPGAKPSVPPAHGPFPARKGRPGTAAPRRPAQPTTRRNPAMPNFTAFTARETVTFALLNPTAERVGDVRRHLIRAGLPRGVRGCAGSRDRWRGSCRSHRCGCTTRRRCRCAPPVRRTLPLSPRR